jgi:hypothetical protein
MKSAEHYLTSTIGLANNKTQHAGLQSFACPQTQRNANVTREMRFDVFFFAVLSCYTLTLCGSAEAEAPSEAYPTSQPTNAFVAPTVPEEFEGGGFGIPSVAPTPSITQHTGDPDTGETFEEEIKEENRTAITTSSYMFVTFVTFVALILAAYFFKRLNITLPVAYFHHCC